MHIRNKHQLCKPLLFLIENQINPLTIKNQEKEIERPLFILYETPLNLQFSLKNDNIELLKEIYKRLDTLNIYIYIYIYILMDKMIEKT